MYIYCVYIYVYIHARSYVYMYIIFILLEELFSRQKSVQSDSFPAKSDAVASNGKNCWVGTAVITGTPETLPQGDWRPQAGALLRGGEEGGSFCIACVEGGGWTKLGGGW